MRTNYRPKAVAFIDFETQSECDIALGHRRYADHPTTQALTCVVRVDGETVAMGAGGVDPQKLMRIAEGRTMVAHNAPFDSSVWERVLKLPEVEWFDTLPCCRAAGLPGALDEVGRVLTGRGKDQNGKKLIDMLCIIRRGRVPAMGPAHRLLLEYNIRDVELLEEVYARVQQFAEPDAMSMDAAVNARGVPVHRPTLMALREAFAINKRVRGAEFDEATGGVNPNSPKQIKEWMEQMGFELGSIGKQALKDFMASPDAYFVGDGDMDAALSMVAEAMEARSEVARAGSGKADRALSLLDGDDRIRDQFLYYGAHTGRWSGRSLQLHNMPSPTVGGLPLGTLELTYEAAKALADENKLQTADVLGCLLRHMVKGENLLVADYGAVEARGIAWIAEEHKLLRTFSDPKASVYVDFGERVYGRRISKSKDPNEYVYCKSVVLGCGYGLSGAKFEAMCRIKRLDTAGCSPVEAVRLYRETYPRIVAVWKDLHNALHACSGRREDVVAGRCLFTMVGGDMHCVLPSGRPIVYRNARIEPRIPGYCKLYGMPEVPVPTVVFDRPRGTGFLYGSKVAENIVQALCRDLLARALSSMEQVGLRPVLHVHDEAVCEAPPERFDEFMGIMSTPPKWAAGFPILVEGYCGATWSKVPRSFGYRESAWLNGGPV